MSPSRVIRARRHIAVNESKKKIMNCEQCTWKEYGKQQEIEEYYGILC